MGAGGRGRGGGGGGGEAGGGQEEAGHSGTSGSSGVIAGVILGVRWLSELAGGCDGGAEESVCPAQMRR